MTKDHARPRQLCPTCQDQHYDERVNPAGNCMACQARQLLADGAPLEDLPLHDVAGDGVQVDGGRLVPFRYVDGSKGVVNVGADQDLADGEGYRYAPLSSVLPTTGRVVDHDYLIASLLVLLGGLGRRFGVIEPADVEEAKAVQILRRSGLAQRADGSWGTVAGE